MPTDRVYCGLCCACCGGVWWRVALRCGPLLPSECCVAVCLLRGAAPVGVSCGGALVMSAAPVT